MILYLWKSCKDSAKHSKYPHTQFSKCQHLAWPGTFVRSKSWLVVNYWLTSLCCCCYSVTQSCLTLCDPMDCSPPGSSVHGISQARILGWVALSSSRESSRPRDQTHVSCIGRQILHLWATREALDFTWILLVFILEDQSRIPLQFECVTVIKYVQKIQLIPRKWM